jgi:radical SAM protein with 4Fe4S-binding SPASM domain
MSEYVNKIKQLNRPLASRLGHLDIELTERCNNNCVHCYINQPEDNATIKAREMGTAFVKEILNQSADLGCLSVSFTGGEPLLREDFAELYLYTRQLGLKVSISTNARLITSDLARLFARIIPGRPIEVSVYGMQTRSYDAVAGVRGAFIEFQNGINLLQEYNIPFVVKQSLLPQNRDEISDFEAFATTLPAMKKSPVYTMNFDLRARRDDENKNRRIRRLRISPQETLIMLTRDPERYIKIMRQFAAKFMKPPGDKIFSCGAGRGATVDAYGKVQMCLLLRHPDTVYPLDEALHRERHPESQLEPLEYALTEFFPRVREMHSSNPQYLERCAVCFLKSLCDQCPAKSWEEHGTLDTPVEYFCQVAHAKAVYLGLLLEGENSWELTPGRWQSRIKEFLKIPDN